MRIAVAVVVGMWLVVAARPAEACGWAFEDSEYGASTVQYSDSIWMEKRNEKAVSFDLERHPQYGLRAGLNGEVVFHTDGARLGKHGRVIATITGSKRNSKITFGTRSYTIEIRGDPHNPKNAFPRWFVTVKRDNRVIIKTDHAFADCTGEVRARVMFYLAWRETGA